VKVPDGAAGAELFVGAGVLGAGVGFLLGAAEERAVVGVVLAGVVAGAIGVVGCVIVGAVDASGVVFFAVLDGDALAEDAAGELPFDEVIGGADTDSPVGVLVAATGVMPGTWVLNEKSAARPAMVPPRVRTARRIQPPEGEWLLGWPL
jgi:hypothetical protein